MEEDMSGIVELEQTIKESNYRQSNRAEIPILEKRESPKVFPTKKPVRPVNDPPSSPPPSGPQPPDTTPGGWPAITPPTQPKIKPG